MERNFILLEEILNKYLAVAQGMSGILQCDGREDVRWFYQGQLMVLPSMINCIQRRDIDEFWKYISWVRGDFMENLTNGSRDSYIWAGIRTILNAADETVLKIK